MTPEEMYEFYANPENLQPQGPARKRKKNTVADTIIVDGTKYIRYDLYVEALAGAIKPNEVPKKAPHPLESLVDTAIRTVASSITAEHVKPFIDRMVDAVKTHSVPEKEKEE